MSSTLITSYLAPGLAAARPVAPAIAAGTIAIYYATDTGTVSLYDGSTWHTVGGGYAPGSTPSIVQVAHNNNGSDAVTFGVAPTNGNLLVAIAVNPSVNAAGSGWTQVFLNSSGTDYGTLLTKTAGAGESTTQTPLSSSPSTGGMVVWEIAGANATPIASIASEAEASLNLYVSTVPLPIPAGCLFLGAIGLVSTSNNFVKMFNVTQDVLDTSGTGRQIAAGHATLGTAPIGQLLATLSGSGSPGYKPVSVLITT